MKVEVNSLTMELNHLMDKTVLKMLKKQGINTTKIGYLKGVMQRKKLVLDLIYLEEKQSLCYIMKKDNVKVDEEKIKVRVVMTLNKDNESYRFLKEKTYKGVIHGYNINVKKGER